MGICSPGKIKRISSFQTPADRQRRMLRKEIPENARSYPENSACRKIIICDLKAKLVDIMEQVIAACAGEMILVRIKLVLNEIAGSNDPGPIVPVEFVEYLRQ